MFHRKGLKIFLYQYCMKQTKQSLIDKLSRCSICTGLQKIAGFVTPALQCVRQALSKNYTRTIILTPISVSSAVNA